MSKEFASRSKNLTTVKIWFVWKHSFPPVFSCNKRDSKTWRGPVCGERGMYGSSVRWKWRWPVCAKRWKTGSKLTSIIFQVFPEFKNDVRPHWGVLLLLLNERNPVLLKVKMLDLFKTYFNQSAQLLRVWQWQEKKSRISFCMCITGFQVRRGVGWVSQQTNPFAFRLEISNESYATFWGFETVWGESLEWWEWTSSSLISSHFFSLEIPQIGHQSRTLQIFKPKPRVRKKTKKKRSETNHTRQRNGRPSKKSSVLTSSMIKCDYSMKRRRRSRGETYFHTHTQATSLQPQTIHDHFNEGTILERSVSHWNLQLFNQVLIIYYP